MIGTLLLTHSFLGNAFIQAVEQLLGPQDRLRAIDINGAFDHTHKWQHFIEAINALNNHDQGVLVLTDLFGSAPSNLALAGLGICNIEVVVGLNLPMLLSVLENRHRSSLEDLAKLAKETGQKAIKIASSFLIEKGKEVHH